MAKKEKLWPDSISGRIAVVVVLFAAASAFVVGITLVTLWLVGLIF